MKPSKFANMPPRVTKGTLTTLAKKQVQADEAKAAAPLPPVDESKFETKLPELPVLSDEAIALQKELNTPRPLQPGEVQVNDAAAGSATKPDATPPVETAPVAASPPAKEVKPPKGTTDGLYALGKRYSPKTDRNSETWGKICRALADGPKTMKELAEAVKGHGDFLGYMTRGGHIVPHKAEEKVSG